MNKDTVFLEDQSVVKQVDALLLDAIKKHVSDIHLEQSQDSLRVRFRIDGVLINQRPFSLQLSSSIIGRLKVLAHLNIAERRVPQDGKLQIIDNNSRIDIRISTFPCIINY